jgi:phosphotriesterase-related protein
MIVRTVLGDIEPGSLGVTFAHEHLIIDSEVVAQKMPHISLPLVEEAVAEVSDCASAGVGTLLDAMPTGSGRNLEKLAVVSRRTGVNVVATTGMHTRRYYDGVDWVDDPADALATRFIAEILDGVDGIRAGVMKVASSTEEISPDERELFVAAGLVHSATDVPVLTHCEDGRGALEQIGALVDVGIEPDRILLSHTDKVTDRGYHREILSHGFNVEYDQALRRHLLGSDATARLIADMWQEGFGHQILLGTDGARRSLWTTLGGAAGLAWLYTGFKDVLTGVGLDHYEIETMFVTSPARVLSFNPPH